MRQRGRKSGAGLGILQVDGKPNRLTRRPRFPQPSAPSFSTWWPLATATIFVRLIFHCWFAISRPPRLAIRRPSNCGLGAVINGKPSPWITVQEKAVRAMVALSMRLRLSPQSRIDAKTLGRQEVRQGPAPWEYGNP